MAARTTQRVKVGARSLELSNLGKVFYPATGFTKGQVLDYYARIAPVMVPHLKGRPLNLKRYPNGVEAPFFFQKEAPANTPAWLRTFPMWSDTRGGTIRFCTANDAASLVWLANTGNLEFHSLLCKAPDSETPTMMVFDLDPGEGAGLLGAAAVALLVRDALVDRGLESFAKVSGGKGVQVYVPLNVPVGFDDTRDYALALAQELERRHPTAIVSNMRKELRKGKVLIDYSQNSRHKSTVSPYSLRARATPSVSAPVKWSEVEFAVAARDEDSLRFTPPRVLARVRRMGDLFAPVLRLRQHLEARPPKKSRTRPSPQTATPSGGRQKRPQRPSRGAYTRPGRVRQSPGKASGKTRKGGASKASSPVHPGGKAKPIASRDAAKA